MPDTRKQLKPHQRNIATFLAQQCPSQDGVILYHYMGTGKSFSSMTIAINWGKDMVILAPDMLLAQWKNDYVGPYQRTRPNIAAMVSYETVWKLLDKHDHTTEQGLAWYKNHTLVMDECHNIADCMNNRVDISKRGMYMKRLMSFGKRVLLTGTPMYWGPRDLAFQVNIAAGKPVMPVDSVAFEREFFKTDLLKAAIVGWVQPVHTFLQLFINGVGGIGSRIDGLAMQIGVVSTYMALSRPAQAKERKKIDTGMAVSQMIQKVISGMIMVGERVYIKAVNKPLSYLTKKLCAPVQGEYKKRIKWLEQNLDVEGLPQSLNMDAFDASIKELPVNESDYFVYINKLIDSIRETNAAGNSSNPRALKMPVHPGKGADGKALIDYHKNSMMAILGGVDEKSREGINDARKQLERELKKNCRSPETMKAIKVMYTRLQGACDNKGKQHVDFFIGSFVRSSRRVLQTLITGIQYIVVVLVIQCALCISKTIYTNQHTCRYINTAHFERQVSPYISYYKPELQTETPQTGVRASASRWLGWLKHAVTRRSTDRLKATASATESRTNASTSAPEADARTFPIVIEEVVRSPYNRKQTDLFIKFSMGALDYQDYAALQIIDSPHDCPELESFNQESQVNYETYGSYIGNVCAFQHDLDSGVAAPPHVYHKSHVTFDAKRHIWTFAEGCRLAQASAKLDGVVARIRKHGGRHCVYSNYELTSRTVCAHLVHTFGADAVRFVCNRASSKVQSAILNDWYYPGPRPSREAPKIIILDTRYTEGLSVLKTDAMHILDPCQSLAKEEQLKARVARLNSHRKGDTLHIYEYMSYCPLFQRLSTSVGKWAKLRAEFNYFSMQRNFAQDVTPEYVVKSRLKNMDALTEKLTNKLRHTSVEKYMPELHTVAKYGVRARWKKPLPDYCGKPLDCVVATPGNAEEWDHERSCRRQHTQVHGAHTRGGTHARRTRRADRRRRSDRRRR